MKIVGCLVECGYQAIMTEDLQFCFLSSFSHWLTFVQTGCFLIMWGRVGGGPGVSTAK